MKKPSISKCDNTTEAKLTNAFEDSSSYLDIYNVQNPVPVDKCLIEEDDKDIMFLDGSLSLLKPHKRYVELINALPKANNVQHNFYDDCEADISDISVSEREDGNRTIYPVITGSSNNPYIKYKSNRSSAYRRMRTIDCIGEMIDDKINCINLVLTFPKEFSNHLFNMDNGGIDIADKIFKGFWKRCFGKEYACFSNFHGWKSSEPFKPHYHFHNVILNYTYDKETKQFTYFNPYFSIERIEELKKVLHEEISKYFKLKNTVEELNIWLKYQDNYYVKMFHEFTTDDISKIKQSDMKQHFEGYENYIGNSILDQEEEKAKLGLLNMYSTSCSSRGKLTHMLKYNNRTYLYDVGKYLDYENNPEYNDEYKSYMDLKIHGTRAKCEQAFLKFASMGCIKNRTRAMGYAHHVKKIAFNFDLEFHGKYYVDKEARITSTCPVTNQKVSKLTMVRKDEFSMKRTIAVYVAHKAQLMKICEIRYKKPESKDVGNKINKDIRQW